jgi:hypothetical protein
MRQTQQEKQGDKSKAKVLFLYHCCYSYYTRLGAIFLKEIGSGTNIDPKFGRRGGDVSYIDAREKVPACVLLKKNFRNGVTALFVTKYPWW